MAGVAQLVELWIVIPMPLSNISDLTPKTVRTSADGWFECRPNADQIQTNRKERMGLWRVSDWLRHLRKHIGTKVAQFSNF